MKRGEIEIRLEPARGVERGPEPGPQHPDLVKDQRVYGRPTAGAERDHRLSQFGDVETPAAAVFEKAVVLGRRQFEEAVLY